MRYIPKYKCRHCGAVVTKPVIDLINFGTLEYLIKIANEPKPHFHEDANGKIVDVGICDLIALDLEGE